MKWTAATPPGIAKHDSRTVEEMLPGRAGLPDKSEFGRVYRKTFGLSRAF
jgi:hypothetical protein